MAASHDGRGIVAAVVNRRRTLRLLLPSCAAIVATAVTAPSAGAAAPPQLSQALDAWTAAHPETGILVSRLDTTGPTEILSYKADIPRRPASTMKVVTAAASLIALGPQHRFQTKLYAGESVSYSGATLQTTLYLKGSGDPTLSTPAYLNRYLGGAGSNINRLVRPLRQNFGITSIRGPIVVDESTSDTQRRIASWPARYAIECQPLSAVNINQGYLGDRRAKYVKRPPLAAGVQLREAMKRMGVRHTGKIVTGRVPVVGRELASISSPPLRTITRLMLPPSDNYIAETLTKNTGTAVNGVGTTASGTAAATRLLGAYLSPQDRLIDGSGLDRGNRLTPRSMVSLLSAANNNANWGAPLIDSLPRGGQGTLKRRFVGSVRSRVHAKTGYIANTTTLVGVVDSPSGVRYAFALFMNDNAIGDAQRTQNRIVSLLGTGIADNS